MIPSGRHLPREFLSPALQNQQGPEIWGVVTGAALMLPPPESDHILVIEAPNEGVFSKNATPERLFPKSSVDEVGSQTKCHSLLLHASFDNQPRCCP